MSDDRTAFLRAIIDSPDDDLPRLVFADWLEENGDADRAEYIRIECAVARDSLSGLEREILEEKAKELLARHKQEWQIAGIPGVQKFRRGFVEDLYIAAGDFIKHSDWIGRAAPVVGLRLSALALRVAEFVTVPWLPRLRTFELRADDIASQFQNLFLPGLFAELRSLIVRNDRFWFGRIAALTSQAASFPKLERLDLSGNRDGDDTLMTIAGTPSMVGLRDLVLRSDGVEYYNRIHASGAAAFASSPNLTGLRLIDLAGQAIGDAGFRSLVESANLRTVETLDVSRNGIGEIGSEWAVDLIASTNVGKLRELNLSGNTVNRLAADELSVWPQLRNGCIVDLRGCAMPANALRSFRESEFRNQFRIDEVQG